MSLGPTMDLTAQLEQLKSLVSRPLDSSASYPIDSTADPEFAEVGHSDAVNVIGNLAFEPSDPLLDQSWRGGAADHARMQFRPDVAEFVPGQIHLDRDPSMNPDAAMFFPHPEAPDSRYTGWEGKGGSYGGWGGSVDRYGAPLGHAPPSWQKGWPPAASPGPVPGQWPPSAQPGVGPPSPQGGFPPPVGKGGMYHPMYRGQPSAAGGPPPGYPGQSSYWDGYDPQGARGGPHDHAGPAAPSGSSGHRPPHGGADDAEDDRLDAPIWYVLDPKKKIDVRPFFHPNDESQERPG
mmetsp:Transcript_71352/g.163542  ORF Transcript_71352/g.163542 Transcript_71352/m.163542 type:complete len:292 (+) Transcript_71352:100-975(+)